MLSKTTKNSRGFSLVEILAIIVIIGILAGLGIPAVLNYIKTSRDKTFFTNVKGIVEAVNKSDLTTGATYCIYEDAELESLKANNIEEINIISTVDENGKKIYSVSAIGNNVVINTRDFSSLSVDKKSEWAADAENGYEKTLNETGIYSVFGGVDEENNDINLKKYSEDIEKCVAYEGGDE